MKQAFEVRNVYWFGNREINPYEIVLQCTFNYLCVVQMLLRWQRSIKIFGKYMRLEEKPKNFNNCFLGDFVAFLGLCN